MVPTSLNNHGWTVNAFVCMPYSKVKQDVLESWLELGEKLAANFISSRDGPVKSTETRQGMLRNSTGLLLVSNAMH